MNQKTAKRLRRLVANSESGTSFNKTRYRSLKKDWAEMPWNQRDPFAKQLESVVSTIQSQKQS